VTLSGVKIVYTKISENGLWVSGSKMDVDGIDFEFKVKSIECRTTNMDSSNQKVVCLIISTTT
jgi:hypothetical protein